MNFDAIKAQEAYCKASFYLINSHDQPKQPKTYKSKPDLLGRVDGFGNYLIQMPENHVYIDDRNFISKYMQGERIRSEKDARIEAFSKFSC